VGVGEIMVIRLDIETWVIGKGGIKRGQKRWRRTYGGCCILWALCVFGCISVVVCSVLCQGLQGASGSTVGTVG
jgi:hypothetical protein